MVGAGGFGPPKLKSNRFTVCPLWPLGNTPSYQVPVTGNAPAIPAAIISKRGTPHIERITAPTSAGTSWSWWTDSNPRPADYKSAALPAELHQRMKHSSPKLLDYYITDERFCQEKNAHFLKFIDFLRKPCRLQSEKAAK